MKKFIERLCGSLLIFYVIFVTVVFARGVLSEKGSEEGSLPTTTTNSTNNTPNNSAFTTTYSTADVSLHNSSSSCWTFMNGKVYDVTSYFGSHPGGDSTLVTMCGVDGSSVYNSMHRHSSMATNIFDSFYIGNLKN